MKFLAVIPTILAACAAEASLPIAAQYLGAAGLYNGVQGAVLPYAGAYGAYAPAAVDAKFAYGAPITALNAGPLTPAPVVATADGIVAAYSAFPGAISARYAPAYSAPISAAYNVAPVAAYNAAPVAAVAPAPVAAPVAAYNVAPVAAVAAAPVAGPVSSQFQAQDEYGNLAYGYNNINSAKEERGNALGGVTGSYTYQDEAGVHTVNYVADDFGFRVAGDNLPVAPANIAVAPVYTGVAPVAPVDTAEVAAAKAEFFEAYEAATKTKRSADANIAAFGFPAAATYGAAYGFPATAYGAAYGFPAATYGAAYGFPAATYAAAPAAAAREAIKTTVKLNPGHAVFYRYD